MQTFTAFPLRARGTLEIFDASIKLYKQYFWVLLGWSAIVTATSFLAAFLPVGGLAAIFVMPISIGSVVCCIAAAVRGQNVAFGQCWNFTQPRYWPMLGMLLLACLIGFILLFIVFAAMVGIGFAGVFAFRDMASGLQIVLAIIATLIFVAIGTLVATLIFSWASLVPIVICMEENMRGTASMGRSYEILKGHWGRITGLMAIVSLAILVVLAILSGFAGLIIGFGNLNDLVQGRGTSDATLWLMIAAISVTNIILSVAWTPLYYLLLTVFYLDVRVRQEALDLEWTAHTSAPVAAPQEATFASVPVEPTPAYGVSGPGNSPIGLSNPAQETTFPHPPATPTQPYGSPMPGNTSETLPEQPSGS